MGVEGSPAALAGVDFGAGERDSVGGSAGRGIEVLEAVVALGLAAEDVPTQTGGDGEGLAGSPGVLNKRGVVGIGFSGEEVLGEVGITVGLGSGLCSHTDQQRCEIAAAGGRADGLVGGGDVEGVGTGRGRRLADVEEALHVFEAGGDFVLAEEAGDGSDGVAILAGVLEGVVVGGAADVAAHVVEDDEGKQLVDFLRCQRRREAERGDVEADLARVAALFS